MLHLIGLSLTTTWIFILSLGVFIHYLLFMHLHAVSIEYCILVISLTQEVLHKLSVFVGSVDMFMSDGLNMQGMYLNVIAVVCSNL